MKSFKIKNYALVFMVMLSIIITPVNAFAATKEEVQAALGTLEKADKGVKIPDSLSGKLSATATETNNKPALVNGQTYYYSEAESDNIVNEISNYQTSGGREVETLENIDNTTFNLKADTAGATGILDGLRQPLSIFLGVIVVLITTGMTIFTAFDLCYIAFPVFRGKMDTAKANGTKGVTRTDSKGNTKLTFVTEDAQYAVVAAETTQTGKSAFIIYGKKRVISFVVLAVLIFILLTGNINVFANIGLKLASGVLKALGNF